MRWVSWYDECYKYLWISIVSMDFGNPWLSCNIYRRYKFSSARVGLGRHHPEHP